MLRWVIFCGVILLLLIVGIFSFQETGLPKKGHGVPVKNNAVKQVVFVEPNNNTQLLTNNYIEPSPSSEERPNANEDMANPLPIEWEDSFFSILNNSTSREDRNTKLILFATTSAKYSPRVQQECLSHITYGLTENDGDLALQVLKDDRIAISARRQMFKDLLKIRSDDFCYYLSSGLVSVGDQGISSEAKANLLKYVKSEQKPKEGNTSK
jgi:hypothetical protein